MLFANEQKVKGFSTSRDLYVNTYKVKTDHDDGMIIKGMIKIGIAF